MQVKKEPDTEPLVDEAKPMEGDAALTGEDKLSTAVPEDVSLNTPVSNSEEIAASTPSAGEAADTSTTAETSTNGTAEPSTAPEEEKAPEESNNEGVTEDSVSNSLATKEEGGDLEGSVTAEDPPNPFDSDDDVVDDEVVDEPVADEPDDLMSQVPPPLPASSSQENMEATEAVGEVPAEVASPMAPAVDSTPAEGDSMEPDSALTTEGAEAPASSLEPMDTSVSNSDDKSETSVVQQDSRTEIVNGQSMDSHRSAEEDLLTSTTNMEEGDEQYKNIIAESQMDNIFN